MTNSQADLKVIGIGLRGVHNQGTREMDASAGIGWGEGDGGRSLSESGRSYFTSFRYSPYPSSFIFSWGMKRSEALLIQ